PVENPPLRPLPLTRSSSPSFPPPKPPSAPPSCPATAARASSWSPPPALTPISPPPRRRHWCLPPSTPLPYSGLVGGIFLPSLCLTSRSLSLSLSLSFFAPYSPPFPPYPFLQ